MRLDVIRLGHAYLDDVWLFQNLTYSFAPGRSYALTGASGSGKSTMMAIISGWVVPREGRVVREGVSRTSWVFQNPHGNARRLAIDHVAYPLITAGRSSTDADAAAAELMSRFELSKVANREFRHLSGGEAQRLMLARATAAAPDLLLVDEPTAQLDRATARVVNRALSQVVSERTIVVVATHDEETRDACDVHLDLTGFAAGEAS